MRYEKWINTLIEIRKHLMQRAKVMLKNLEGEENLAQSLEEDLLVMQIGTILVSPAWFGHGVGQARSGLSLCGGPRWA